MAIIRKIAKFLPGLKRLFIKVFLFVLLIVLVITGLGLTPQSMQADFCVSCHEMKPEYATFKVSAHSQFSCTVCHQDMGLKQMILHKDAKLLTYVVEHFTKSYKLPIQSNKPISNSICESCHSQARTVTPRGDIRIPHDKHMAQGITCVTCHLGVAHGTITERTETIDGEFDNWNESLGKQNMPWQYRTLRMSDCLDCHKSENGPQDCKACHSRIIPPKSHQNSSWSQGGLHAQEAFEDISTCNSCHSYSLTILSLHLKDPVIDYVRTNVFCANCHKTKPQGHNQDWAWQHGVQAQRSFRNCLVCHDQGSRTKSDNSTTTTCVTCHKGKHKIPTIHPVPLPQGTRVEAFCYRCHPERNCSKCHK